MLFQINHKSLNANSFIGELFGFFDEIKKQYLSFLTHQIAETDTKLIQYTKDELFLENPKIEGSCFRDLSIEAQYKYVLEIISSKRITPKIEADLKIFELVDNLNVIYFLHIDDNANPALCKILLLHNKLIRTNVELKNIEIMSGIHYKIFQHEFNDNILYQESYIPNEKDRLKHLSYIMMSKNIDFDKAIQLKEMINNLELKNLENVFLKLNIILQLKLEEKTIKSWFDNKGGTVKRRSITYRN